MQEDMGMESPAMPLPVALLLDSLTSVHCRHAKIKLTLDTDAAVGWLQLCSIVLLQEAMPVLSQSASTGKRLVGP